MVVQEEGSNVVFDELKHFLSLCEDTESIATREATSTTGDTYSDNFAPKETERRQKQGAIVEIVGCIIQKSAKSDERVRSILLEISVQDAQASPTARRWCLVTKNP